MYGTEKQQEIGYTVAKRCFEFLLSDAFCGDHDSYNLMKLIEILQYINSPLVTDEIIGAMKRRIKENVCYDNSKWNEYNSQPLDFADSLELQWYECVAEGVDSDISRQVTENCKGYITVRRASIFMRYNRC